MILIGDYLRAIEIELRRLETPREVDTLYFGGGTPTHLIAWQFEQLGAIAYRLVSLGDRLRMDSRGESGRRRPRR